MNHYLWLPPADTFPPPLTFAGKNTSPDTTGLTCQQTLIMLLSTQPGLNTGCLDAKCPE